MKEDQTAQKRSHLLVRCRNRRMLKQESTDHALYESTWKFVSCVWVLKRGWRWFRNQGEHIYSLTGSSCKLNYILAALMYEGNLK